MMLRIITNKRFKNEFDYGIIYFSTQQQQQQNTCLHVTQ